MSFFSYFYSEDIPVAFDKKKNLGHPVHVVSSSIITEFPIFKIAIPLVNEMHSKRLINILRECIKREERITILDRSSMLKYY